MPLHGGDGDTGIVSSVGFDELVTRNLDGWVRNSVDIPRIVRRVQLPAFECDIHAPYAWPRSSRDAGSPDVSRH
jgi:hypothetical protein